MRRPLDLSIRSTSSSHLGPGQDQVGQLVPAVPGDEHPRRVVDPDLLHGGVVEEGLQRPEPGHPRDQLTDHRGRVRHRSDDSGQAALVVVAHHGLGDPPDDRRVTLRIDALDADGLADALVELLDQLRMAVDSDRGHQASPPEMRHLPRTLSPLRRALECLGANLWTARRMGRERRLTHQL